MLGLTLEALEPLERAEPLKERWAASLIFTVGAFKWLFEVGQDASDLMCLRTLCSELKDRTSSMTRAFGFCRRTFRRQARTTSPPFLSGV